VPVGTYEVDVRLFVDGAQIARTPAPFEVSTKSGFEQVVTAAAREHGVLYGLATAMMAIATGWFASVVSPAGLTRSHKSPNGHVNDRGIWPWRARFETCSRGAKPRAYGFNRRDIARRRDIDSPLAEHVRCESEGAEDISEGTVTHVSSLRQRRQTPA